MRRRPRAIAGVLLLAGCIGLAPSAVAQQTDKRSVQISGQVSYSHVSPPASGVKLIEDIFQRVRSAPQIAMARNLMKQQIAMEPADALKIRPKSTTATTRMITPPGLNIYGGAGGSGGRGLSNAFMNEAGNISIDATTPAAPALVPQVVLGSKSYPMQTVANKPAAPGLWESQQIAMSEERKDQPKPLAQSVGRLFGALNGINQVQDFAARARQQNTAAEWAPKADRIAYKDEADSFAQDGESRADELSAHRREKANSADKKTTVNARAQNKYVHAAPASAPEAAAVKEEIATYRDLDSNTKRKLAMADIALLPPNVVTGIPLVRLGSSETQANAALQAIGSMKQQKVNKWTVWSWNRPQSKNGTSLQLYIRNGLLDAMRIFDSSLIGQDFGVNLGDTLAQVKERFGEPAFILQEPGPGAGQNYVYPISQIGFQLARPQPGSPPRVVSVLIFNVK